MSQLGKSWHLIKSQHWYYIPRAFFLCVFVLLCTSHILHNKNVILIIRKNVTYIEKIKHKSIILATLKVCNLFMKVESWGPPQTQWIRICRLKNLHGISIHIYSLRNTSLVPFSPCIPQSVCWMRTYQILPQPFWVKTFSICRWDG